MLVFYRHEKQDHYSPGRAPEDTTEFEKFHLRLFFLQIAVVRLGPVVQGVEEAGFDLRGHVEPGQAGFALPGGQRIERAVETGPAGGYTGGCVPPSLPFEGGKERLGVGGVAFSGVAPLCQAGASACA